MLLISLGMEFHSVAAALSNNRLPIRIVLCVSGTNEDVSEERRGLFGEYHFNCSHRYIGASLCSILNVNTRILYWHRLLIGSQCNDLRIGVIGVRRGVQLITRAALL